MTEVVQNPSCLLLPDVEFGDVILQANGKVGGACSGKDGGGQGQGRSQDDVLELHFVQGRDCMEWVVMSELRRPSLEVMVTGVTRRPSIVRREVPFITLNSIMTNSLMLTLLSIWTQRYFLHPKAR